MRDLAIVLALSAASCVAARPIAAVNADVPLTPCGNGFACAEGGGTGTLLVPIAAIVTLAVVLTVAYFTDDSVPPDPEAQP